MTGSRLVVFGDSLLDSDVEGKVNRLCPDAPVPVVDVRAQRWRPGGAGLAALLAARAGHDVVLVTALGIDPAARLLADLLAAHVEMVRMPLRGATVCKTRIRAGGRSLLRVDTGDGRAAGAPTSDRFATVLHRAEAVLVCDYGLDVTADPAIRDALIGLGRRVPVVWDPHPRGAPPVPGCRLVTPNETEAVSFLPGPAGAGSMPTPATGLAAAAALRAWWRCDAVAITLGARGAALATADGCTAVPVPEIEIPRDCDPCGAGDAFAAAVTGALLADSSVSAAVTAAVCAASQFVAGGGAASVSSLPTGSPPTGWAQSVGVSAVDVVARLRRRGGRLVATGGCFDLLHPGHLSLLRQARALGDALVVCVNSDESVRRRKGPGRPIVPAADRITLLEALEPVDAVIMFDEDTPSALLETLRPDLWVKGGDYTLGELPEAAVVHRHGGQVMIIPLVGGYSTSRLVSAARSTWQPEIRRRKEKGEHMRPLGNVLITGGASGLGAATAQAVLAAGGRPLILDRSAPLIEVDHVQADLADRIATENAVAALVAAGGGELQAVFTAAGIDSCGPFGEVPAEEWERVIAVNLLGTARVVRAALPHLERSRGTVVTCSSTLGLRVFPDATAYCAAKFGVIGFTRALAAETAGRIGVTLLIPGGMHTAFFDGRDEQYKPPPDAKLNRPEDVAATVIHALRQPPGCELREMVVCSSQESSWP